MIREDIQALRTPLTALGVVLLVSLIIVMYSGMLVDHAHQRLAQEDSELRQARLRIQNAGQEQEMISRYLGSYEQLAQAGFIGDEQRINWLDGLRLANQQSNIFGVEYDISAQKPYAYSAEFNPGVLHLNQSVMHIRLRLLHEEDLPRFLQALARQGGGIFTTDECVLRRSKPGETEAVNNVQPNLIGECELSWLTAKPPVTTEKKG